MSAGVTLPFRARGAVLALGADDAAAISVRVQLPELWETVAVRCGGAVSVAALKGGALEAFGQRLHPAHEYVMKLRGYEVRDEAATVTAAGAQDGSTFLLTYRHRRPVR